MSIQGVGNTGSWEDFVKLVQDARQRSKGIGGGLSSSAGTHKGAQLSPVLRTQHPYGIMKNDPATALTAKSALATKMAGSFFDAYA